MISVSIVSHGHGVMVGNLVKSLLRDCPEVVEIIVTRNVPEFCAKIQSDSVIYVENSYPKGFSANHNAAFRLSTQPYFCVLNPDIELVKNPFPPLIAVADQTGAGLVAPVVKAPNGGLDDSVRHFPTLFSLVKKAFGGVGGRYSLSEGQEEFFPEWVAGMFMLFRSSAFALLDGFDERFFLYYEDVDICVRAWTKGVSVAVCPKICVIHDARRDSRRNLAFLRLHCMSMARYFWKHWGRLPQAASNDDSRPRYPAP